jgi:hypothetical protein
LTDFARKNLDGAKFLGYCLAMNKTFHIEKSRSYVAELCPITNIWTKTKLVLGPSYSVYGWTDVSPTYQYYAFEGSKQECIDFANKNGSISQCAD